MSDDTQTPTPFDPRDQLIARLSVENEQLRNDLKGVEQAFSAIYGALKLAMRTTGDILNKWDQGR